jgi:putative membrane protein
MTADLPAATKLAVDRTRLAYERTLMAWVRTATSLISFGFTIYKFFQFLRDEQAPAGEGMIGLRAFAMLMIGIGLTALLLATLQHRRDQLGLAAEYGQMPYSLAAVVASLVAVLGVLGFLSVLLRF